MPEARFPRMIHAGSLVTENTLLLGNRVNRGEDSVMAGRRKLSCAKICRE